MSLIRNPKDFGSGCLFAGFGLVAVVLGATYPAGTAARMAKMNSSDPLSRPSLNRDGEMTWSFVIDPRPAVLSN